MQPTNFTKTKETAKEKKAGDGGEQKGKKEKEQRAEEKDPI